jgi:hypothetical protein
MTMDEPTPVEGVLFISPSALKLLLAHRLTVSAIALARTHLALAAKAGIEGLSLKVTDMLANMEENTSRSH